MRMRRQRAVWVLGAVLLLAAACGGDDDSDAGSGGGGDGDAELQGVTLYLDFAFDGLHAPFLLAQENGCFSDEGLDVDIRPGQGSADAVRIVGAGQAEFGIADAGAVLHGVAEDIPVQAVGALLDRTPAVIVSLKDSGITEPADLADKSYGDAEQASTGVLFPAFLAANDLAEDDVQFVGMNFAARVPSLQSGQVDTIGGYIQEFANIQDDVNFIPWADHGIGSYGSTIIANDSTVADDPDLVRSLLSGATCGFDAMMDDPEAAAAVVAEVAEGDPEYFAEELTLLDGYWSGSAGTFGQMDEVRWNETQDLLVEVGSLAEAQPAEDVWTDNLLP